MQAGTRRASLLCAQASGELANSRAAASTDIAAKTFADFRAAASKDIADLRTKADEQAAALAAQAAALAALRAEFAAHIAGLCAPPPGEAALQALKRPPQQRRMLRGVARPPRLGNADGAAAPLGAAAAVGLLRSALECGVSYQLRVPSGEIVWFRLDVDAGGEVHALRTPPPRSEAEVAARAHLATLLTGRRVLNDTLFGTVVEAAWSLEEPAVLVQFDTGIKKPHLVHPWKLLLASEVARRELLSDAEQIELREKYELLYHQFREVLAAVEDGTIDPKLDGTVAEETASVER